MLLLRTTLYVVYFFCYRSDLYRTLYLSIRLQRHVVIRDRQCSVRLADGLIADAEKLHGVIRRTCP